MEGTSLPIRRFEEIPTAEEFALEIESKNVPAVFTGCISNWKAFSAWNPSNGGLDYLQEQAGSSVVEAMLSRSAPIFYGNIRGHERVPLPFSTFIGFCKKHFRNSIKDQGFRSAIEHHKQDESLLEMESSLSNVDPQQVYLAQVPIMNSEKDERSYLEMLKEDIQMPAFVDGKEMAAINLWMNNSKSRSSTHYDPHQNLLCVVTGCKQVTLWPPSASPFLYPMPLYSEASNHSCVALGTPDLSTQPRAKLLMEYSQRCILHAGDVLFIPEGWFHQVDSDDLTIAVNFWWRSNTMSALPEHMDSYYLRIILRRLIDKEMNQVFCKTTAGLAEPEKHTFTMDNHGTAGGSINLFIYLMSIHPHLCFSPLSAQRKELISKCGAIPEHKDNNTGVNGEDGLNGLKQKILMNELEPPTLHALHELVSLVHDCVNVDKTPQESCSLTISSTDEKYKKNGKANMFNLEDDRVAYFIWTFHTLVLRNVLLAMAHNFPRTLEALILHLLSPVGAEALTRKFDEMDRLTSEQDRNIFYEIFYGAFDDQFGAMNAILNGKESFALQAFRNVLDQYMGVNFNSSNPSIG
ncbi:jmjC domain-containing protein C [Impatiens glandulifera]|uniref:jmjC domain-containing protein C n=1 Tax=Impatiens glandulifera TaxID=253017 RepID=UPI001FB12AE5|nr:jmjC domain-containing protein C [Impatiens glandulifera]